MSEYNLMRELDKAQKYISISWNKLHKLSSLKNALPPEAVVELEKGMASSRYALETLSLLKDNIDRLQNNKWLQAGEILTELTRSRAVTKDQLQTRYKHSPEVLQWFVKLFSQTYGIVAERENRFSIEVRTYNTMKYDKLLAERNELRAIIDAFILNSDETGEKKKELIDDADQLNWQNAEIPRISENDLLLGEYDSMVKHKEPSNATG